MSVWARRVVWALGVVVLGALAVWGATRLWQTTVPGSLPAPAVDIRETFGARRVERAESFEALLRRLSIAALVVEVAALGLWAWIGARWSRESAAGPIGTGFVLGMLGLAVVWITQLPFTLVAHWWLRDHDITDVGYVATALSSLTGLSSTFLGLCVVLAVAMGFARLLRWSWWIPAGASLLAVFALLAFLSPYLTMPYLEDASPRVQREADRLSEREGLDDPVSVSILRLDDLEDQPNAFAFGLGPSSHIVLFDVLADRFSDEEVRSTVAHEVGHVAHHHIAKSLGWTAIVLLLSGFAVAIATRRRGGMAAPAAVPVALLVVTLVGLAVLPLESASSRRYEAEADWAALEATRDPQALEDVMKEFTRAGLADPDPPGWWHEIFDSHPSMSERVEMARAWAQLHR